MEKRTSAALVVLALSAFSAQAARADCTPGEDENRVASAFFQSSKVIWGYERQRGVRRISYSFSNKENVLEYANQIQGDVQSLKGICLKWAHVLRGVKDNGVDLDWATLVLNAPAVAKTGRGGVAEGEGLVGLTPFFKAMRALLTSKLNPWKPLFGVVDSNYFHQMSAPLVEHAFNHHTHTGERIRVLVQIDHHSDFPGGTPADNVRCNNWINYVTKAITVDGSERAPVVDKVLWVNGVASACNDFSKNQYSEAGGSLKNFTGAPTIAEQLAVLVPSGKQADIYVTVDRDIMSYNYTGWNNGYHSDRSIQKVVADIVQFAALTRTGSHIVGIDVTGLPEDLNNQKSDRAVRACEGQTILDRGAPRDKAEVLLRAHRDIAIFYQLLLLAQRTTTAEEIATALQ
jgi:hypothetical protein